MAHIVNDEILSVRLSVCLSGCLAKHTHTHTPMCRSHPQHIACGCEVLDLVYFPSMFICCLFGTVSLQEEHEKTQVTQHITHISVMYFPLRLSLKSNIAVSHILG